MEPRDFFWMEQALCLARLAEVEGEIPVGAVLVDGNNQIIGRGSNQMIQRCDPTAHAEILAIRQAGTALNNYRLLNTTLYVTLEPCCMCAGAIVHARIKRLVFAARDFKSGAAGSVYHLLRGYPLNHQVQVDEGLLQRESTALLSQFFSLKTN